MIGNKKKQNNELTSYHEPGFTHEAESRRTFGFVSQFSADHLCILIVPVVVSTHCSPGASDAYLHTSLILGQAPSQTNVSIGTYCSWICRFINWCVCVCVCACVCTCGCKMLDLLQVFTLGEGMYPSWNISHKTYCIHGKSYVILTIWGPTQTPTTSMKKTI